MRPVHREHVLNPTQVTVWKINIVLMTNIAVTPIRVFKNANPIMNVLFMKSVHRVDVLKLIQATVLMITIVMMTSIAMTRFVKWRSVNTIQIVTAMKCAKIMSAFIIQS
jgi:hypothetical protein